MSTHGFVLCVLGLTVKKLKTACRAVAQRNVRHKLHGMRSISISESVLDARSLNVVASTGGTL